MKPLLEATTKKSAEMISNEIIIMKDELVRLIVCCGELDYKHTSKFVSIIPDSVQPTAEELAAISQQKEGEIINKPALRFINKIMAQQNQKKQIAGHLF